MTVAYVKDGERGYLRVGVADGDKKFVFSISQKEYREIGEVRPRDEISEEQLEFLTRCDELYKASLRALRILSYGDNSKRMLAKKLYSAGVRRDIIDEVVEQMLSLGYINEERQISRLVLNEVTLRFYGPRKIIPKLISKGYDKSEIEAVISTLVREGEVDFSVSREKLLAAKLSEDAGVEEKNTVLYKYGYNTY